ncbi:hypothetical protein [Flavobacterium sp. AED]|uniref:hypothetical protein n=1 Tax=Flavobacterium sp. AED TaxID=1423323 RepID=UPI00068BF86E|nr:hypothetical protein [Flavobacterium sp. AED]
MIQVADKYGKNITVTNLPEALQQADYFRDFAHTDKAFKRFDQERQAYWQDLYEKLVKINDLDIKRTKL